MAAREPDNPPITEVIVEPDLCMRFMNCLRIAPKAFRLRKDIGRSSAPGWRDVDPALLWQAGRSCPSGAIRILTEEGYVIPRWQETDGWKMDKHPAAGRAHDRSRDPYEGMV